jgi:ribosome-associated protein
MSEDDDYISRSQLKREAEEAQRLGEQLIALKEDELEALDLPESLMDAIRAARKIRQHGALRRQRQLIGKLMRKIDIRRR